MFLHLSYFAIVFEALQVNFLYFQVYETDVKFNYTKIIRNLN